MRIVFMGSSSFALPSLEALFALRHKVVCLVTQPDRLRGRGLHLEGTPVKRAAEEFGLEVFQPKNINTQEAEGFLAEKDADLFVVVSFGQILSKRILNLPRKFCINAHASLLPKYRGAAPINWAIINGEKKTGVTIIRMNEYMDAGAIIQKQEKDIGDDDNSLTLQEELSKIAADLLVDSVTRIEDNNYNLIEQDEEAASLAPKLKKEDGLIDWERDALDILNLIRGCFGWPGAFTFYRGKLLKIYEARLSQDTKAGKVKPGEISQVSKEGISVSAVDGQIIIKSLQIEGKRRMGVEEFISGCDISVGDILTRK